MEQFGERIKEIRNQEKLSLKKLAEMTNTTSSFLSQVENNKSMPSLPVLKSIADALGTTISYILDENKEQSEIEYLLIRKDERKTLSSFGVGLQLQFLSNLDKSNKLEPTIHVIQPKYLSGTPPYKHDGQEFVMILKGSAELILGDKRLQMDEGDSCCFDASVEHSFQNCLDDEECQVLCVSTAGFFQKGDLE